MNADSAKQVPHYACGTVCKGEEELRIVVPCAANHTLPDVPLPRVRKGGGELTFVRAGGSGFTYVEGCFSLEVCLFVNGFVPIRFFVFVYDGFVQRRMQDKGG